MSLFLVLKCGGTPALIAHFHLFGNNDFDVTCALSVGFHGEVFLLADQAAVLGVGQPGFTFGEEDNGGGDEDDETREEAKDYEADDLTWVEERFILVDGLLHGDLQHLMAWMVELLVSSREDGTMLIGRRSTCGA